MWKTQRELLACISRSPSLRAGDQRHRCGNPHPLRCASGGPLSFFGKRKGGKTSASTVRRDVGIAPYGYFEGWCRRADVGIAPYGAFNGRCA